MALPDFQQTGTIANASAGAYGTGWSAASGMVRRTATVDGSGSETANSITVPASTSDEIYAMWELILPNDVEITEGNWTVRLETGLGAMNLSWTAVAIVHVNSSNVVQAEIGRATGLGISLTVSNIYSTDVPVSAVNPANGDKILVLCALSNSNSMSNVNSSIVSQSIINTTVEEESGDVSFGSATLTAGSTLEADGVSQSQGAAELIATATVLATAVYSVAGAATLDGNSSLTATGTDAGGEVHEGSAILEGDSMLTATGQSQTASQGVLSGSSGLVADGIGIHLVEATLEATSTLTATPTAIVPGTAELAGTSTLEATANYDAVGAAELAGTSTLTANGIDAGIPADFGEATLAGTSELTATAIADGIGAAELTGDSTLTATGIDAGAGLGAATLAGDSELTATASTVIFASAFLEGTSTLFANPGTETNAQALLAGDSSFEAHGGVTEFRSAQLDGTSALTGSASVDSIGAAILVADSALIATASYTATGQAIISGTSAMIAVGKDIFELVVADHLGAIINYLRADADVMSLTGGHIYGEDLPRSVNPLMPRGAIVVRSTGGPGERRLIALSTQRVDIRCYGTTPYWARRLSLAVEGALKFGLLRKSHYSGEHRTLLHSATLESSANITTELNTDWPVVFSSWLINSAEQTVRAS